MIQALMRTAILVAAVFVLAPYVPLIAQHQALAYGVAVALGLLGFFVRFFVLAVVVVVATGAYFFFF